MPPVMEARRWKERAPAEPPLINVSQGAPVDPPPAPLRAEMARLVEEDAGAHLYGPVLGLPALREALAARWSEHCGGAVGPANVAITAGCNQAFATAIATLAGPGDNVLLPVPWYFNHKMWLDQTGIEARPIPAGPGLVPDPAAARIDGRTRAVVLVSPNNPAGVEYPPETLAAFLALARERGIALLLDETYRDFHSAPDPVHDLYRDPDWADTLIGLYSFSKAYRLTGHRVGAMLAHPDRLAQAEKVLDCVTICAPALGQRAALWGLAHLRQWLAGERAEVLSRAEAMRRAAEGLPGWEVEGLGAYFAYLRHPFEAPSDRVAHALVARAGVLALPGTMFAPDGEGGRHLRVAFANLDAAGIAALAARLADVTAAGLKA
jgi:aspartate/methionine/tyrosine aminotransferase